jgi:hypothetical protein
MAYIRDTLVSRAGYSGVGGTLSDIGGAIKDIGGGALSFYGSQQQAVGAAQQAAATNRDLAAALAAKSGPGMGTLLLVGGAGLVAFMLLRKKKAAP